MAEAVQLVEMYHTQHNSSAPPGLDGLKASAHSKYMCAVFQYCDSQVHLAELGVLDQWDSLINEPPNWEAIGS